MGEHHPQGEPRDADRDPAEHGERQRALMDHSERHRGQGEGGEGEEERDHRADGEQLGEDGEAHGRGDLAVGEDGEEGLGALRGGVGRVFGERAGHRWRATLRSLICLGTPHHGAPLERGGNLLERLLGVTRYSAPLARLARLRSAGVTDLRYGNVLDEDWAYHDKEVWACFPAGRATAANRAFIDFICTRFSNRRLRPTMQDAVKTLRRTA